MPGGGGSGGCVVAQAASRASTAALKNPFTPVIRSPARAVRLVLNTPMQGHYSGCEVEIVDAIEAGVEHEPFQRFLVGMNAYRFREIAITFGVAGDRLSEPRQHLERIEVVERREGFRDARE